MAQVTMYPAQVNSPITTLSAGISNVATTIPVVDATKLPAGPNIVVIGEGETAETILYTGKSGNDLTGVTRGLQGTAQAWDLGTILGRFYTAYDHDTFKANIEDLVTNKLSLSGGTLTDTLNLNVSSVDASKRAINSVAIINQTTTSSRLNYGVYTTIADVTLPLGITNTGALLGIRANGAINNVNFAGTLAEQTVLQVDSGFASTAATAVITNCNGFLDSFNRASDGTITNKYGLKLVSIGSTTVVTNWWDVYAGNSSAKNYFAGNVGIGYSSPTSPLFIDKAVTDLSLINIYDKATETVTVNGSTSIFGIAIYSKKNVATGITSTGNNYGVLSDTRVDNAGFAGTLSTNGGYLASTGFSSLATAGVITDSYGFRNVVYKNCTGATITNQYGIRLDSSGTGTTITNWWDVYAGNAGAKNYFAGNVGIGISDIEAWTASFRAIEIGTGSAIVAGALGQATAQTMLTTNAYYDSSWKYKTTDEAARYTQNNGAHTFSIAALGTLDTAVTWVDAVTVSNAGNLGIGITNPSAALQVVKSYTDISGTGNAITTNSVLTANGNYTIKAIYGDTTQINIPAGVTNTGTVVGVQSFVYSSNVGFAGTLTNQIGFQSWSGMGSTGTSGAVITNSYGLYDITYRSLTGGTITNKYGVYLSSTGTATTITNWWDIYAGNVGAKSYFAGNVGIGTTDVKPWHLDFRTLQLGYGGALSGIASAPGMVISTNAYYDTEWKYKATNLAAKYYQQNGYHLFQTAISGTIDTAITWVDLVVIDALKAQFNTPIYNNATKSDSIYNGSGAFSATNSANLAGSSQIWGIRTDTSNAFNLDVYNAGTPITALKVTQTGDVSGVKFKITPEGGYAIKVTAGEALNAGEIVYISQAGANGKVFKAPTSNEMPIGVVYATASIDTDVWIVISGIANVLPESGVTAARGYIIYTSATTSGRAAQSATAPGAEHWREIGHFLDTGSGNGVATRAILHFN